MSSGPSANIKLDDALIDRLAARVADGDAIPEAFRCFRYLHFVAHDLSVVRHISDRIGVMYLGHVVRL